MKSLLLKKNLTHLNNERGIAALVTIILAIIILGSVAFNFVAETRQKQSGSILTYTSTNALMIAEAGLRYTQKCLTVVDVTWGCPTILQDNSDWTTISAANNFGKSFGDDGNFSVSFPINALNDPGKIFVISTGTYKGGQRSLSRFITRACVLGDNAITSCLGTTTKNNSYIDPPLPDPPVTGVCPDDPPGFVNIPNLTGDCDLSCSGVDTVANCPDFDPGLHLLTGNILDPAFPQFCNFKLSGGDEVKTNEANHLTITVIKDFEIKDNATLKLNFDAVDPFDSTKNTTITVYDDATLKNNGEIRVNGTLSLEVADTFDMKNSSRVNHYSGASANGSAWVDGDVTIKNSSLFIGSVATDGTLSLKNNAEVQGALFGNEVTLKNNATVIFTDNEDAGSNTDGYAQCSSGGSGQIWSE
ncbi:MAG: hypothetical protein HOF21_09720 [Nitrospina sp.]|nr:hypothetical protein [Nitrospina sp.]